MPDNFEAGEVDADSGAPAIETMGARYGISETQPVSQGRGGHEHYSEPYLMPKAPTPWNGEPVVPAIQLTPLGGQMPGPNAIAPALPITGVGTQTAFPCDEDGTFQTGIIDGWPDGVPVPTR